MNRKRKLLENVDFEDEEQEEETDTDDDDEEEEEDDNEEWHYDESDSGEESSIGEIDDVTNNINLKDMSDDDDNDDYYDAVSTLNDNDDNDDVLFLKISNDIDNDNDIDENKISKQSYNIKCIRNDIEPISIDQNKNITVDEYEYDSSDEEDVINTIGNIPLEWYNDYVHIGYDKDGRKIIKPNFNNENEIDEYFEQLNDRNNNIIKDNLTGQKIIINNNDVNLIKQIKKSKCPDINYNPYESFIDFFTYEKMIHPIINRPETKQSFIPSLSEKRLISRLVSAIKKAKYLKKSTSIKKRSNKQQFEFNYDLWDNNTGIDGSNRRRLNRYITAPKMKPPGHEESYNPPLEYLFNDDEKKQWLEQDVDERKINFIPQSYNSLRQVPSYPNFVQERFERLLDLYLCPRVRKTRINVIDPNDLIPELPKPSDLQPFPSQQSMLYEGHDANINCITIEQSSSICQYLLSGDDNGIVKLWDIISGRCMKTIKFSSNRIQNIFWSTNNNNRTIVSIIIDSNIYIINIGLGHRKYVQQTDEYFDNLFYNNNNQQQQNDDSNDICKWKFEDKNSNDYIENGLRIKIEHKNPIKQFTWHNAGEYFATLLLPSNNNNNMKLNQTILIHNLKRLKTQIPFKKISSNDTIQFIEFHPTKALFFVSTKRIIRIYDLIKQQMLKKILTNFTDIRSLSIHYGGDNLLINSNNSLIVQWYDLDLSTEKPYKTLNCLKNKRSTSSMLAFVNSMQYHKNYPLFFTSTNDGYIIIYHCMIYNDDLLKNPLIVPVKILRIKNQDEMDKNQIRNSSSTTIIKQCLFHPNRPWLFVVNSNKIRLFT